MSNLLIPLHYPSGDEVTAARPPTVLLKPTILQKRCSKFFALWDPGSVRPRHAP